MDDQTPPDTAALREIAALFDPPHPADAGLIRSAADEIDRLRAAAGEPQPATDAATEELRKLRDVLAEVTEARRVYQSNFGAMGTPGTFVGRMPTERYELGLSKILSVARTLAAGMSPSTPQNEPTECRAESGAGFMCTLAAGHHGGHVAVQDDGGECDRWDR